MLLSDLTFRMASIRMAEAHSKSAPTWMYLFAYRGGEFGAGHGEEVAYVFDQETPAGSVGAVSDRAALHRAIQDSWIAFARTGDPNNASVPTWPRYAESDRATVVFDTHSRIIHDPLGNLRQAWHGVPFDGLVPDIDQASGLMTLGGGGKYFHWGPQIQ